MLINLHLNKGWDALLTTSNRLFNNKVVIKAYKLKSSPTVKQCQLFLWLSLACHYTFRLYLLSSTWTHPCYFPHTPVCSKVLLRIRTKMLWSFLEAYEKCLAYGAPSQPSLRRLEPKKFSYCFRVLCCFVSVIINMFSAIYNIDFVISILCYMCGLPGHTYDDSGLILKARVWHPISLELEA